MSLTLSDLKKEGLHIVLGFAMLAAALLALSTCGGCTPYQQGQAAAVGAKVPAAIGAGLECWRAIRDAELFSCAGEPGCESRIRDKWSPACESQGGCDDAPVIAGPSE